jgi:CRP-like cAMP-binding protein
LDQLEERERRVRRGGVLLSENDRLTDMFVLRRGMMMSYVLLDDGSRQILRFMFPGDVMASAALAYATAPDTIMAISESVIAAFDRAAIADMVRASPRLAMAMMALQQRERVAMTDRLAAIGRTSAKARVAALLLQLRNRMREGDPLIVASFMPGITQEEMGDATGLTAVHVNRMLRQLEDEGMIARDVGRFTIVDEAKLARSANFIDRDASLDLSWLPSPE